MKQLEKRSTSRIGKAGLLKKSIASTPTTYKKHTVCSHLGAQGKPSPKSIYMHISVVINLWSSSTKTCKFEKILPIPELDKVLKIILENYYLTKESFQSFDCN